MKMTVCRFKNVLKRFKEKQISASKLGTPETLEVAIRRELREGPMSDLSDRLKNSTMDYLAQRFSVAMFEAGDDEKTLKILQDLWKRI